MDKKTKMLLASVSPAALTLVGGAYAADLPVKAPHVIAAPAPAYSWTGCYVGAHVGYGWGKQDATRTHDSFFFSSGSSPSTTHDTANLGMNTHGGVYGGQVGCNYQFASNWVFGVEAMLAGTGMKGNTIDPLDSSNVISVKTDYLGSAVARLGFTTSNNQALWYVKGGMAGAHNKWSTTAGSLDSSEDRLGWTVGGGLEWAFIPNWSAFVDFSYYDFGNGGHLIGSTSSAGPCGSSCVSGSSDTLSSGRQQIEIVKLGVNYKFIGP